MSRLDVSQNRPGVSSSEKTPDDRGVSRPPFLSLARRRQARQGVSADEHTIEVSASSHRCNFLPFNEPASAVWRVAARSVVTQQLNSLEININNINEEEDTGTFT